MEKAKPYGHTFLNLRGAWNSHVRKKPSLISQAITLSRLVLVGQKDGDPLRLWTWGGVCARSG